MIKKENGLTLIVLIITIIIMLILVGVVIYNSNIVDKSNYQRVLNNMTLIQTKASIISEKATFETGESIGKEPKLPENATEEQVEIYNKELEAYTQRKTKFDNVAKKYFVGEKLKESTDKEIIAGNSITGEGLNNDYNYIWDRDELDSVGLEGIVLVEDEVYIVNYVTLDIIYPKGCIGLDGNIKYNLSKMIETTGDVSGGDETCNHEFGEWKSIGDLEHERTCIWCGAIEIDEHDGLDEEATCTEGVACSYCGEELKSKKGHSWSSATCTKAKTCSRCGTTTGTALGHNWGSWSPSAECTSSVSQTRKCSRCGRTGTRTIGAQGHNWQTYSEAGTNYTHRCTRCGAKA